MDAEPALRNALGNRFISINTWDTPKRSRENLIAAECYRAIAESMPLMNGNLVVDPAFPTMKAHRAHIYAGEHIGGYFDFTTPPCAFAPLAMARLAMLVLERKRKKAASYRGERLWLVMSVTDTLGEFDESVKALGSVKPVIEPFELVIIRGGTCLTAWSKSDVISVAV